MARRDAVDLVFNRAGVGVDIDACGVQDWRHWLGFVGERKRCVRSRVVAHRRRNCEENTKRNMLATAYSSRTIVEAKHDKKPSEETPHDYPARNLPRPGLQHRKAF